MCWQKERKREKTHLATDGNSGEVELSDISCCGCDCRQHRTLNPAKVNLLTGEVVFLPALYYMSFLQTCTTMVPDSRRPRSTAAVQRIRSEDGRRSSKMYRRPCTEATWDKKTEIKEVVEIPLHTDLQCCEALNDVQPP